MIDASVELILIGVLGPDACEIVCGVAARRIGIALQQLGCDGIECVYRDHIARVRAMIRGTKDLAHSRLDRIAIRVHDVHRIARHRRRYRTIRL